MIEMGIVLPQSPANQAGALIARKKGDVAPRHVGPSPPRSRLTVVLMTVIKRQMRTTKTPAEVLMLVLDGLVDPLDGYGYRLESQSIHGVAFARRPFGILELWMQSRSSTLTMSFVQEPDGGTLVTTVSDGRRRLPPVVERFNP
jgi:hypothetical protein